MSAEVGELFFEGGGWDAFGVVLDFCEDDFICTAGEGLEHAVDVFVGVTCEDEDE